MYFLDFNNKQISMQCSSSCIVWEQLENIHGTRQIFKFTQSYECILLFHSYFNNKCLYETNCEMNLMKKE